MSRPTKISRTQGKITSGIRSKITGPEEKQETRPSKREKILTKLIQIEKNVKPPLFWEKNDHLRENLMASIKELLFYTDPRRGHSAHKAQSLVFLGCLLFSCKLSFKTFFFFFAKEAWWWQRCGKPALWQEGTFSGEQFCIVDWEF